MSLLRRRNSFVLSTSFFDEGLTSDLFNWTDWSSEGCSLPKVNIVENNDSFRVEMAAPGMKKDDFQFWAQENHAVELHSNNLKAKRWNTFIKTRSVQE